MEIIQNTQLHFKQSTEIVMSNNVVHIFTTVLLVMNEKYTILKLETNLYIRVFNNEVTISQAAR
jgi:hypothetical protein